MKERIYLNNLYDIYGELLDSKKKEYFEMYYFDNLSLGEIAELVDISRNAVHKRLKKTEEKLKYYEEVVGLYRKEQKIMSLIADEKLKEKIKELF